MEMDQGETTNNLPDCGYVSWGQRIEREIPLSAHELRGDASGPVSGECATGIVS